MGCLTILRFKLTNKWWFGGAREAQGFHVLVWGDDFFYASRTTTRLGNTSDKY